MHRIIIKAINKIAPTMLPTTIATIIDVLAILFWH